MRILHLVDRLTERGGAYVHLLGLVASEARRHDVLLGFGREDGSARPECETSRVPGLDARERAPVDLDAVVERHRPELVRTTNVVNPAALEAVARLEGVEKIAVVQDHRFFCPGKGKWTAEGEVCSEPMSRELCRACFSDEGYFHEIYALTEERLRALVPFRLEVLSEYMKRELVAAGLAEDRIRVVHPVFQRLDAPADVGGPPLVLFVGRLVEAKGVRDAVEAWRLSRVSYPLVFVGTGPLRGELESAGFEVLGWLPHERMATLYRRAACVLMPSRWQEPCGIAGLEAIAMETPVVAWHSGGVSEWSESARRIPWGDVRGLAAELAARCQSS